MVGSNLPCLDIFRYPSSPIITIISSLPSSPPSIGTYEIPGLVVRYSFLNPLKIIQHRIKKRFYPEAAAKNAYDKYQIYFEKDPKIHIFWYTGHWV